MRKILIAVVTMAGYALIGAGVAADGQSVDAGLRALIKVDETFDPVAAGWKRVFEDDFDGPSLDLSKWRVDRPSADIDRWIRLEDGLLKLSVGFPDGCTNRVPANLVIPSIWTRPSFLYGYFEARLRFTRQNGYWAAFWLWNKPNVSPLKDGFEIDIFEDFFTRRVGTNGRKENTLGHALHLHANGTTMTQKSFSSFEESADGFHVIGCKWTPFCISLYLDGRLIRLQARHLGWDHAVFDPFTHGTGAVPLHAIVSTHQMTGKWTEDWQDLSGCTFPDTYAVDWVRIYDYPNAPEVRLSVAWSGTSAAVCGPLTVREGETRRFEVKAEPAQVGRAALAGAYLFDSGLLLAQKSEPPYVFDVAFTREFYGKTAYMRPAFRGAVPKFAGRHFLSVFVRDADGRVSNVPAIEVNVGEKGADAQN